MYVIYIYIYIYIYILCIFVIYIKFSKQLIRQLYCVNSVKFMTYYKAPSTFFDCVICIGQARTRSRIKTDVLLTTLFIIRYYICYNSINN